MYHYTLCYVKYERKKEGSGSAQIHSTRSISRLPMNRIKIQHKSVSGFLFSCFCRDVQPGSEVRPEAELWAAGGAGLTFWNLGTWRAGPRRQSPHGWPAPTPTSPCRPSRASPQRARRPASRLRKQSAPVRRRRPSGWMNEHLIDLL